MSKLEELEDRVENIERATRNEVVSIDSTNTTTISFSSSSYVVDIEIDVASTLIPHIELDINGTKKVYDTNFVSEKVATGSKNTLVVNISTGGLLSKKIRIEGIGVRLLSV